MRKFWKKLAAMPVLLAALATLAACAGAAGGENALDPNDPVTVTLWHYYVSENQQALEAAVSAFNQTVGIEKGVIVEPVAMGSISGLEAAVTDSAMGVINAKPMPQLFSSYPDKALEIDKLGMVADLAAYYTPEERGEYVPGFLADGVFDGGRMLLSPIVKSTELMYLNATAWREFVAATGLAEEDLATWEALYNAARAYYQWVDGQTPGVAWDGRGMAGFDSVANFIIIGCRQLGVDVIDAEGEGGGRANLDEAALRRVFDIYWRGMALGYLDEVSGFRSDDIKAGDLIASVGSSSSAAYFPTWVEENGAQRPIDFMALACPVFEGGQPYAMQQGAGMCVAKSTPAQQQGAVLFLKWFTRPEQNIGFAMNSGYLPVQQAAYDSEAFSSVLQNLRDGDAEARNVADVYEIALRQITGGDTYAARPFAGSYDVRSILQATLMEAAQAGRADAAPLKARGLGEDEVLARLNPDARFADWLDAVRAGLDAKGIAHG